MPESSLPATPVLDTETRIVMWYPLSRRNTSLLPLLSPATRLLAAEVSATNRPSSLIPPTELLPLAGAPPSPGVTSSVRPAPWPKRVRRKTSKFWWPGSAGVGRATSESNATNRPLAVTGDGPPPLCPGSRWPAVSTLTASSWPEVRSHR